MKRLNISVQNVVKTDKVLLNVFA